MPYFHKPTTLDDIHNLAPRMRSIDQREVWASGNYSPYEALMVSWEGSAETFSMVSEDGVVACIYGIGPVEDAPTVGVPWMLASEELPAIAAQFLRASRRVVDRWSEQYDLLYNAVSAENTVAIEWLRWLGFKFTEEPIPYGVEGELFYIFTRTKDV